MIKHRKTVFIFCLWKPKKAVSRADDHSEWTRARRIWRRSLREQPSQPSANIRSDSQVRAD